MKRKNNLRWLLSMFLIMATIQISDAQGTVKTACLNNRFPLVEKQYMELPLGSIKPSGWLKEQLEIMKNGMTGNLDSLYKKVIGHRNAWLGGDGDAWERGPYWIDGLIPLAYILNDKPLIDKAQKWVEWALNSQKPDGSFGPDTDRGPESGLQRGNSSDWWPRMVVLKFLVQYYSATGDTRVISFMTNYFRYQLKELPAKPLNNWTWWGEQRGGDNLMVVYWLYNITGDKFLLDLGELIHKQTAPWTNYFTDRVTMSTLYSLHCVNVAQGVKEPVVYYQQSGDKKYIDAVKTGFSDLDRAFGWPTGLYGGDEMLHSNNPTQGSEFCSAVEMMFSLETMLEITGDEYFAERLERVAFNALPTQATDNYDSRQYYSQLNQVRISLHDRNFMTYYDGTDQLFGILTGYPCCTCNMHQGWPKFTQNLWYATDDNGAAALIYSPCEVTMKVAGGTNVKISEVTSYPFEEKVRFMMDFGKNKNGAFFPLHLRVPTWCREAVVTVNGKEYGKYESGRIIKVTGNWKSGDVVVLSLPMYVETNRWYENSAVIEHGPLLYALKVGEEWKRVENKGQVNERYGSWYYEVNPTTPWNYALYVNSLKPENLESSFKVERKEWNGKYPWNPENCPVSIKTSGKKVDSWTEYNGSAGPLPYSDQDNLGGDVPSEEITLIPYGCSTLRITEFPVTIK